MMAGFVIRKGLSYAGTRYTLSRYPFQVSGYRERTVDPTIRVYRVFVCRRNIIMRSIPAGIINSSFAGLWHNDRGCERVRRGDVIDRYTSQLGTSFA